MSSRPDVRHFISLKVGGSDEHRIAQCMAAIYASQRGWRVEGQENYKGLPSEPDLVISKRDKIRDGARIREIPIRYRIEVVSTHDPVPSGRDPSYDDVLKIFIGDMKPTEIWEEVRRVLP